jgi:hypothetical protein
VRGVVPRLASVHEGGFPRSLWLHKEVEQVSYSVDCIYPQSFDVSRAGSQFIQFLQINATIWTLKVDWPPAIKRFAEVIEAVFVFHFELIPVGKVNDAAQQPPSRFTHWPAPICLSACCVCVVVAVQVHVSGRLLDRAVPSVLRL